MKRNDNIMTYFQRKNQYKTIIVNEIYYKFPCKTEKKRLMTYP